MSFTLPDKGEGDHDHQSVLFQEYLDVLVAGINGIDCVLSGCAITGGADMTPAVAKGAVLSNGVLFPVTAGDVTVGAADATNPRFDLIVVNSSGSKAVRAGTAAAFPKPPARSANDVVLGTVYVPANDTSIETTKISDMRMMREKGPIVIYRQSTAVVVNNTTAATHYLNGSGLTIPSGLFLAGRMLRVRLWGNWLINSTTPTITLVISYGGTTMFQDTSATTVIDADRAAWNLEFMLVAQGNADQALTGALWFQSITVARAAPTAGIGDWALANASNQMETMAFGGSAAVDSDAADRTLSVTMAFSVANAANEHVVEGALVELI